MTLYELLKDSIFSEEYNIRSIQIKREYYSKFPNYMEGPTLEMYHLKNTLTKGDILCIIQWYENCKTMHKAVSIKGFLSIKRKRIKIPKRKDFEFSDLHIENIQDPVRRKELEFRIQIIKELQKKGYYI